MMDWDDDDVVDRDPCVRKDDCRLTDGKLTSPPWIRKVRWGGADDMLKMKAGRSLSLPCDSYLLQLSQTGGEVAGFRPPQRAQHRGRGLSGRGWGIRWRWG